MRKILLVLMLLSAVSSSAFSKDFEYKIYFGLSKPDGGAVSLAEWQAYEAEFAKAFIGFNVAETVGYYKGAKERSRLITLIMDDCREAKLDETLKRYVVRFDQESVLVVKTKLESWKSVSKTTVTKLNDKCEG
ncbi:DUF3574 domain-containing protein [Kordiimonas sp. SCSIO 12603]|uniref:DUF3574 domain-containing protein n=1 Tax=Kordiimonas sp. SCSIO 12603 TaxID=2829596 RepID=UPI002104A726|nr:DUF3574 domain-containing protein [Kordiimonas sp. SCSIO 12603]UTW58383.1 DUF3574 domain-containing protein [Kordiimonas sp. SCSIO 12603]